MGLLWDEFERNKLARETKRGMTEGTRQRYRMGGRAPYGYRTLREPTPEGHRGEAKERVTLTTEPTEAETVALIFHLHGDIGWSPKAIAERLNQPGGPSPPRHVDSSRNRGRHWAQSTIASMLRNPVYTGSMVWNRLDFSTRRQNGGAPRLRAEEEWIVTPDSHPRLVSDTAFKRSQDRFRDRPRQQHTNGGTSNGHGRQYVLAGMVYCCAGHKPMSMQGKARKKGEKTYRYMACAYRDQYGDTAAAEIHGGAKWIYMNEDVLMPLVEEFFRTRIWGPMRLKKLAAQLKSHGRERAKRGELKATKLRQMVATADRNIKQQVLDEQRREERQTGDDGKPCWLVEAVSALESEPAIWTKGACSSCIALGSPSLVARLQQGAPPRRRLLAIRIWDKRQPSDSVTLSANGVQLLTYERRCCPFIETAATADASDQRAQVVCTDGAIDYLTLADVCLGSARAQDRHNFDIEIEIEIEAHPLPNH